MAGKTTIGGILLLALLLVTLGCGGSASGGDIEPVVGSFVGRAADSEAYVAIVTNGSDVRAYICDGTEDGRLTVSEWFKGEISGSNVELDALSGIAHLSARLTPGSVTGSIRIDDGRAFTFAAFPAEGQSGFYLYKAIPGGPATPLYWAGWIVLPGGGIRGSQVTPLRTSQSVSLNVAAGTGSLPAIGAVTTLKITDSTIRQGFQGCTTINCL